MPTLSEQSQQLHTILERLFNKIDLLKKENMALQSQVEMVKSEAVLEKNELILEIKTLNDNYSKLKNEQEVLKVKLSKVANAKNQELIDSELGKKFTKFVIDKQSQLTDREQFLKKIDESISEIDLCIAFLKEI